jgi:hypothetical protein
MRQDEKIKKKHPSSLISYLEVPVFRINTIEVKIDEEI